MPIVRMIAAAALVVASGPAAAQTRPVKPMTMVAPFAAGGRQTCSRLRAPSLSEVLGHRW